MDLQNRRLLAAEPEEDDLQALLAVRLSNPEYLTRTEGSAGGTGAYDRAMLERDVAVAAMDPAAQPSWASYPSEPGRTGSGVTAGHMHQAPSLTGAGPYRAAQIA
jgi:hypothetical protein